MIKKEKERVVSIEDKYYIVLRRIDSGDPQAKIAAELELGTNTVSDCLRRREKIERWHCTHSASSSKDMHKRKTMKEGKHPTVQSE